MDQNYVLTLAEKYQKFDSSNLKDSLISINPRLLSLDVYRIIHYIGNVRLFLRPIITQAAKLNLC